MVQGRTVGVDDRGVGHRRLRDKTRVIALVGPGEPQGVVVADELPERVRSSGGVRTRPHPPEGTVWVVISGGEFFGRTLKAGSIRAELDDLALADLELQVVTCQRMKPELVEGILENLCDIWRETLGRRQLRDMGRVLGDSLGAAPALDGDGGLSESDARVLPVQRDETTSERWRDWKSLAGMICEPLFPDWPLGGPRTMKCIEESKAAGGAEAYEVAKFFVEVSQDRSPGGAFFGSPCRQQASGGGQRYEGKAQTC